MTPQIQQMVTVFGTPNHVFVTLRKPSNFACMHEAAINKEHLQRTSPFHKEVQEREMVKNTVLLKVFTTLYWIAKEEIANTKATSLITLLERLGLQEIKHFQHRSQGSIHEVFLFLGKAIKDKVIKAAASSEVFGSLADEVTDISVLQQFVNFVKYINASGMPQTDFLHTKHMTLPLDKSWPSVSRKLLRMASWN